MADQLRSGVFLDRDGTIIADREYLGDPAGVELLPGSAEAIARLNRAGLPVIVVTNQSGIGRGYFSAAAYEAVQARLAHLLEERGARLEGVYHCPHRNDLDPPCDCRKPAIGLFRRAAADHGLSLSSSYFVGDRLRDVLPGLALGGKSLLVRGAGAAREALAEDPSAVPGLVVVQSLGDAVEKILRGYPRD